MKILNSKSLKFLEEYLNNAAPTGYESDGQKIWMKYLKPYVDEFIMACHSCKRSCKRIATKT